MSLDTSPCQCCVSTPTGSLLAAPWLSRLNQPCSKLNRLLSYHQPSQQWRGAKACALSLGPCPPQPQWMVKLPFLKRHHMGALPTIVSQWAPGAADLDLSCTPPLLSFFNLPQCQNGQSSGSPAVPSIALGVGNSSSSVSCGWLWCYSLFQLDARLELQWFLPAWE